MAFKTFYEIVTLFFFVVVVYSGGNTDDYEYDDDDDFLYGISTSTIVKYKSTEIAQKSIYRFCYDHRDNCDELALIPDECNKRWMQSHCPLSCQNCDQIIQMVPKENNTFNPVEFRVRTSIDDAMTGNTPLTGVPQLVPLNSVHTRKDVSNVIQKARHYMINTVYTDPKYEIVRKRCRNTNPNCLLMALDKQCETNETSMAEECGPICNSCHYLHVSLRCPMPHPNDIKNAWYPGDVDKMFERIVTDPVLNSQYNITVLSKPGVRPPGVDLTEVEDEDYEDVDEDGEEDEEEEDYDEEEEENKNTEEKYLVKERRLAKQLIRDYGGLWIVTIDNFTTEYETERLISMGSNAGYERSMDAGDTLDNGENEDVVSSERTSTNAWCTTDECTNDKVSQDVYDRMTDLTGIDMNNAEPFQLLRYEYGQFYMAHHDLIEDDSDRQQGVRILTIFLYLNDVKEGGGTNFPYLNLTVQPVRGRAVLWPSVFNTQPNKPDVRATHQSLPVLGHDEVKYGANVWVHQRPIGEDC